MQIEYLFQDDSLYALCDMTVEFDLKLVVHEIIKKLGYWKVSSCYHPKEFLSWNIDLLKL